MDSIDRNNLWYGVEFYPMLCDKDKCLDLAQQIAKQTPFCIPHLIEITERYKVFISPEKEMVKRSVGPDKFRFYVYQNGRVLQTNGPISD